MNPNETLIRNALEESNLIKQRIKNGGRVTMNALDRMHFHVRTLAHALQMKSDGAPLKDLIIPVKGVYFDQIASGEKHFEYRLKTERWTKRLVDRAYRHVVLTKGYPKGGGVEGVTRLTREWRGCEVQTITHPHFGDAPVEVFAIDVRVAS